MQITVTHVGTATVILEIGSLRILTDPALDPPGRAYRFGFGTGSTKIVGPALTPDAIGRIDAVLISHDQHADNLDASGRELLRHVPRVITTRSAARRLGNGAMGLAPWQTAELSADNGPRIRITATPGRHGPPLSRPIVGEVVGFLLECDGQQYGALYISGDTVWYSGVRSVARRGPISIALLHMGGVRFPISGPLRYTMTGVEAAQAAAALVARTIVPIHYDGWTHFRDPRAHAEAAFACAGLTERVRWLVPGSPTSLVW